MTEGKEEKRGLVLVITGDGKGKTTSALGQAVRAMGHGFKVFFLQFMKGRTYGEHICAEKYLPNLTVRQCGLEKFVIKGKATPADIEEARKEDVKLNEALKKEAELVENTQKMIDELKAMTGEEDAGALPQTPPKG